MEYLRTKNIWEEVHDEVQIAIDDYISPSYAYIQQLIPNLEAEIYEEVIDALLAHAHKTIELCEPTDSKYLPISEITTRESWLST